MKYLTIIILFIFSFFFFYTVYSFVRPHDIGEKILDIKQGDTARGITNKLYENGIICNTNLFYYYVKFTGKSKHLKYGKYFFKGSYSLLEVIDQIKKGKIHLRKITIPEGYTTKKICALFAKNNFGNYNVFREQCNNANFAQELTGYPINNLEGFLYPETYLFPEDVSEKFILNHLSKEFFKKVPFYDSISTENLTSYEVLILASIVEREAQRESEKPLIASVYLNRIRHGGYRLQADPTVAYALELIGKKRKKIYFKDLKIDSPYNTYKYKGLPPTPICNPSLSSIEAVLNPQKSKFFYFVADKKGGHLFSRTFSEHQRKQEILREQNGR